MDNIENGQVNKDLPNKKRANIFKACAIGVSIMFSYSGAAALAAETSDPTPAVAFIKPSAKYSLLSKKPPARNSININLRSSLVMTQNKIKALRSSLMGTPELAKSYALRQVKNKSQYSCLVKLWNRESNWNVSALNSSSGAYGIPQSLPGRKMKSAGSDWRYNYKTQINWGLSYISDRYGSPCKALTTHNSKGWY